MGSRAWRRGSAPVSRSCESATDRAWIAWWSSTPTTAGHVVLQRGARRPKRGALLRRCPQEGGEFHVFNGPPRPLSGPTGSTTTGCTAISTTCRRSSSRRPTLLNGPTNRWLDSDKPPSDPGRINADCLGHFSLDSDHWSPARFTRVCSPRATVSHRPPERSSDALGTGWSPISSSSASSPGTVRTD